MPRILRAEAVNSTAPWASRAALVATHVDLVHLPATDQLGVVAETVEGSADRIGMQGAGAVDILAEPGDGAVLGDWLQPRFLGQTLRDEQEHRVGADVDGGDAHEGGGNMITPGGKARGGSRKERGGYWVRLLRSSISSTFGITTSSTRRFFCMFSGESLLTMGSVSP